MGKSAGRENLSAPTEPSWTPSGRAPSLQTPKENKNPLSGHPANYTLGEIAQAMADTYGCNTGGPEW
jgi:hypothetical protein